MAFSLSDLDRIYITMLYAMDINCITSYWLRTSSMNEMCCGSGLDGQCLRATCISQLRVKGCTCCSCFADSGLQIVIVKVVVVIKRP